MISLFFPKNSSNGNAGSVLHWKQLSTTLKVSTLTLVGGAPDQVAISAFFKT